MDINVDADGSTVTLSGTVSSEMEKKLAAQLAGNTSGVFHVNDKLHIKERRLNNMNEIACPLTHLLCCIKGPIGLLLDL